MLKETIQKDIEETRQLIYTRPSSLDDAEKLYEKAIKNRINTLKALVKEIEGKKQDDIVVIEEPRIIEENPYNKALQDIQDDITRVINELEK